MSDFMKMDIFFFIASIGFIVLTVASVFITVLLYRMLNIFRDIMEDAKAISADAREVSARISDDIHEVRSKLTGSATGILSVLNFLGFGKHSKKKRASQAMSPEE